MSSKCKQCGEQIMKTGNYTFKILPAKRIPKKVRKLIKNSSDRQQADSLYACGATSFQKFLEKRTRPTNFIELTCGKCGAISKIKMLKNQFRPKEEDKTGEAIKGSQSTVIPTSNKSKKRKARGGKDKSAGLTLTWSETGNYASSSSNKTETQPTFSASASSNKSKKEVVSAFKKKKEMENLKKVLFESKKAKKSGSSLQDFLSAM